MSLGNVTENSQFNTFILKFFSVKIPIVFLSLYLYFIVPHFRVVFQHSHILFSSLSYNTDYVIRNELSDSSDNTQLFHNMEKRKYLL